MNKLNCSNCKYKRNLSGDVHISCGYPLLKEKDIFIILAKATQNIDEYLMILKSQFGFSVPKHAVEQGYFLFPVNFDENWIEGSCSKHSEIIGEAVNYQLALDKYLLVYKNVLMDIGQGKRKKDESQFIIDSYELALSKINGLKDADESIKNLARIQLLKDLEAASLLA